ncbi:MAG: hypothetical protein WEB30_11535 [Cyclobacteriaceae bacterium]
MIKLLVALCFLILFEGRGIAQESDNQNVMNIGGGFGKSAGNASLDYTHNWRLGQKERLTIGIGARFTSFFGGMLNYTTAPAKLTTGTAGPENMFKKPIKRNIDSLCLESSQVNFLNLAFNIGHRFSSKWDLGFKIDLIGFSFGGEQKGEYIRNGERVAASANPTSFNVLLIGDNDRGNLNSELYLRYFISERWGIKAGMQMLFAEYTTPNNIQQFPEPNDRFRYKAMLISMGISHNLDR